MFCLAENSVSDRSTRPDDVHILYSGRSVEINNTDAEGRLVVSDGVVYADKDLQVIVISHRNLGVLHPYFTAIIFFGGMKRLLGIYLLLIRIINRVILHY